jgi:hypothetical protein
MSAPGQTASGAILARDNFVNSTLTEAREVATSGDRDGALRLLSMALHPLMDASSPHHTDPNGNPKEWDPPWTLFGHSPTEFIGNETAANLTPQILEQQRRVLNDAYNRVFK